MKYIVTGGAGFIGSNLVDLLIEEGHEVYVIDNFSSGKKENCNEKAQYFELDISDSNNYEDLKKRLGDTIEAEQTVDVTGGEDVNRATDTGPTDLQTNDDSERIELVPGNDMSAHRFVYVWESVKVQKDGNGVPIALTGDETWTVIPGETSRTLDLNNPNQVTTQAFVDRYLRVKVKTHPDHHLFLQI